MIKDGNIKDVAIQQCHQGGKFQNLPPDITATGIVSGTRTQERLSGKWKGEADGVGVSGKMSASRSGSTFIGTFSLDGGKKRIGPFANGCAYHIAGKGTFRLATLGTDVSSQPGSNSDIQFTCPAMQGVSGYAWTVTEYDCLASTGSISSCSNWYSLSQRRKVYLHQATMLKPVRPGVDYVVGCIGLNAAGTPLDMATGTFSRDSN